jgi:hypothetical protein
VCEARDKPLPHGIATGGHHDGDRLGRFSCRDSRLPDVFDDDLDVEPHQVSGGGVKLIG